MAGLLSVALVVTEIHRRPDVIRLAALWCSDFPLFPKKKRLPSLPLLHGSRSIAKNVEQWNERKNPSDNGRQVLRYFNRSGGKMCFHRSLMKS